MVRTATATATAAVLAAPLLVPLLLTAPPAVAAPNASPQERATERRDCDVDGDRFGDQVVGAPSARQGRGMVQLVRGSSDGLRGRAKDVQVHRNVRMVAGSASRFDFFGQAIACGDFNGDGRADVVVGAPGDNVKGRRDVGSVHVLPGTRKGLSTARDRIVHRDTTGVPGKPSRKLPFGQSFEVGDVNGDGRDDLVVDDVVLLGSRKGLHRGKPALRIRDAGTPAQIGESVGDFDGDGIDDVAGRIDRSGSLLVAFGRRSGDLRANDVPDTVAGRDVWFEVHAGDFDGDGDDDLVSSAQRIVDGDSVTFRAILQGDDSRRKALSARSSWPVPSDEYSITDRFTDVGDVDGDGRDDVIAHVTRFPGDGTSSKHLATFPGTPAGLGTPRLGVDPGRMSVLSVGDRNRDGRADVSIGAEGVTNGPGEGDVSGTVDWHPDGSAGFTSPAARTLRPGTFGVKGKAAAGWGKRLS